MTTSTPNPEEQFAAYAQLCAAADSGIEKEIQGAGKKLFELSTAEHVREVLRFMHLFRGFPSMVRALSALGSILDDELSPETPHHPTCRNTGEAFFRELYGDDANLVLPFLDQLDATLASWLRDHAYGRVMNRSLIPLEHRERLAILLLAADQCWKQWESHARICLRLSIPLNQLGMDADNLAWPHETRSELKRRIQQLRNS
ncbi:MAG TPA: hypothetical protein QGG59_07035 [Planctomycetota bacterium]|jgi:alkylhydroperoxidase/carboxymuconolactone decarboxylase family protein YurZ|nr:hypothetical protein [Planctomycetota bacterium]MDP6129432.1 hypothetical protein [Planctomycetota bacterium]HJM39855.1 hypothetical protein [Planctomycetota bacterium]|tara:strand:- start:61565 stop:62170 length:606 start_codon:yes stop_codon:yes gene_type:complete